jgi:prepilin-type N-terminal cleavage/methylation domain-containing protein
MTKCNRRTRGVGLPELLIALAISGALLVATGAAVNASFKAYGVNQTQSSLAQRARVAMHRMTSYIRTTQDHRPHNDTPLDQFHAGLVCTDTAIRMLIDDTSGYIFRQQGNALMMVPITIAGGNLTEGTPRTLLHGVGVGDFVVTFEPMRSAAQIRMGNPSYDQLKRASILLTVRPAASVTLTGEEATGQPVTLSMSVMPRRNFW